MYSTSKIDNKKKCRHPSGLEGNVYGEGGGGLTGTGVFFLIHVQPPNILAPASTKPSLVGTAIPPYLKNFPREDLKRHVATRTI